MGIALRSPFIWTGSRANTPDRLILAPNDLKTADATAAPDIYAGRFFLAGKMIDCGGADPFTFEDAPARWQMELHAFEWLRHLEADRTMVAKNNAVALISDWLATNGKPKTGIAWRTDIAARRLIAWICHSVSIVEAATPEFYHRWMRAIGTHIGYLQRRVGRMPVGYEKLVARIALAYAGTCIAGQQRLLSSSSAALNSELYQQILEDGMHVSRNPAILLEVLAKLIPLRQAFERLGNEPPRQMILAIDRMMTALKFFRMGNGNLAHFNGVSAGRPELISTLMYFDEPRGNAPESLPNSGYYRLALGNTIVLCDAGSPPERGLSANAHAGTLSFEMSSGANPLVVNCGMPVANDSELAAYARATAAHSTATINDTSSSRFYFGNRFRHLLAGQIISGKLYVRAKRNNADGSKGLTASHDGYLRPFGIIHHRDLKLGADGQVLAGRDRFTGPKGETVRRKGKAEFAIRFHLHPSVSAGYSDDRQTILLMCGGGDSWRFSCPDIMPKLEESSFFASNSGIRRTRQIVLEGDVHEIPGITWQFRQIPR